MSCTASCRFFSACSYRVRVRVRVRVGVRVRVLVLQARARVRVRLGFGFGLAGVLLANAKPLQVDLLVLQG